MPDLDPDAFDAFETSGWAERATGYTRVLAPLTAHAVGPLLDAAGIGSGDRVLDVGTGPGLVAAACHARGADVTGVDLVEEMLAIARRTHPGPTFQQGDAQRLPFADASVDAVLGNFVILHVGRPERAAREFARVLAPGGRVALSTWDGPERTRLLGVLLDALREGGAAPVADIPAGPPFFRFADEAEFTRLLAGAGFTGIATVTVSFTHRCADAEAFWTMVIDGTVRNRAMVMAQPDAVRRRVRSAFDRLAAAYATGAGLDLPVSVKIATAVRAGRSTS